MTIKGYEYSGEPPRRPRKKISARANLTGKRFGRLQILEDLGIAGDSGYRVWGCICDCGTKKAVRSRELLRGHTQSCGCLQDEARHRAGGHNKLPRGQAAANALFSQYRKSARERGYIWQLTRQDFYRLTSQPCHYCGAEPARVFAGNSNGTCNGDYICNGIDRMNNDEGYHLANVVPCCSACNCAKAEMTQEAFLAWIERVYHHSVTAEMLEAV